MPHLLVQACSKSKKDRMGPIPAFELYSGYYYKIIKKAMREGDFRDDIDICILSAEYGIVDPDKEIEQYDRQMNTKRAKELKTAVQSDLQDRIKRKPYESVVVNLGQTYKQAIEGFDSDLDIETRYIEGQLGVRGKKLKQFVRSDCALAFN